MTSETTLESRRSEIIRHKNSRSAPRTRLLHSFLSPYSVFFLSPPASIPWSQSRPHFAPIRWVFRAYPLGRGAEDKEQEEFSVQIQHLSRLSENATIGTGPRAMDDTRNPSRTGAEEVLNEVLRTLPDDIYPIRQKRRLNRGSVFNERGFWVLGRNTVTPLQRILGDGMVCIAYRRGTL